MTAPDGLAQIETDLSEYTVVVPSEEQYQQYVEATHAYEPWSDGMTIDVRLHRG